jgi:hypothetical protein
MASRARILGDDEPSGWELGRDNELDVLVMVFARDPDRLAVLVTAQRDALVAAGASVREPEVTYPLGGKEHLFDLARDARERADRAVNEPALLAQMRQTWADWDATMLPYPADSFSYDVKQIDADRY